MRAVQKLTQKRGRNGTCCKGFTSDLNVVLREFMCDHKQDTVSMKRMRTRLCLVLDIFLTWFLASDDLLDHCRDHVPQLVFGSENTPAVSLVTHLLSTAVLINHLFDTGDREKCLNCSQTADEYNYSFFFTQVLHLRCFQFMLIFHSEASTKLAK